ncbi:argonaute/piwi family protein [Polaribacter porphyrae]|uniref:Protein argonaute n=1 Tax=Polaribacter porphyrae TaxID=1137780 RepID=A0A2S7WJS4_9FLAO|nr:hypothetical protein [Polaribacter porphyrae]PQJ77686.1 hypothetical protein BTO18_00140 [Polaribacter porphyrae]
MKIELLNEPLLEFADDFLCDDPKKGISTTGFYSLSNRTHRSEIHYSVIGTKKEISLYKEMIERFSEKIESGSTFKLKNKGNTNFEKETLFDDFDFENEILFEGINKKLNPDFPGFNSESCFKCEFLNNPDNDLVIKESKLKDIFINENTTELKILRVVELFKNAYDEIIENNLSVIPDIIVIVVSNEIFDKLSTIKVGNTWLNFRRYLKAEILSLNKNIPVQLILEDTITGKKKSIQDTSMIAWNYCVAQYYKTANCTPWTIKDIDADTCYLGISFHKVNEINDNSLRSSIAQAFNKDGKGLVFTGKQFEWNKSKTKVVTPHLHREYARELIQNVLKQYIRINKHTPKRVVVHKTSEFWDSYISSEYDEVGGIIEGIESVLGVEADFDFVCIRPTKFRVLRSGDYPVLRGTYVELNEDKAILYTSGYIPYFNTYPGPFIPSPLRVENIGETPIKDICKEIFALTKMNFNNADYYDSSPITLQFSKKVGEIIQYLPKEIENPPNRYFYYM